MSPAPFFTATARPLVLKKDLPYKVLTFSCRQSTRCQICCCDDGLGRNSLWIICCDYWINPLIFGSN